MIVVKLIAVPAVIWLASWAGRRWGHRVSGLISGFPLIAGPIVLFLSIDAPRAFIAELSWVTMSVAPAMGVHCLVYAWLARVPVPKSIPKAAHALVCLLCAWIGCVSTELLLSVMPIRGVGGAVLALLELALFAALMPRSKGSAVVPHIPPFEMVVRIGAALTLAAAVMLGAETFGPRVSGMLLAFPITASVLPVFTLVLYGADATARLLSGFLIGLIGFVAYFFAFASLVEAQGPAMAFFAGAAASLLAVSLTLTWQTMRKRAAR